MKRSYLLIVAAIGLVYVHAQVSAQSTVLPSVDSVWTGTDPALYAVVDQVYQRTVLPLSLNYKRIKRLNRAYYDKFVAHLYLANNSDNYNRQDVTRWDVPNSKFVFMARVGRDTLLAFNTGGFSTEYHCVHIRRVEGAYQLLHHFSRNTAEYQITEVSCLWGL